MAEAFGKTKAAIGRTRAILRGAIIDFDKALRLDPKAIDIMDDPDDALSLRNRSLY